MKGGLSDGSTDGSEKPYSGDDGDRNDLLSQEFLSALCHG